MLASELTDPRAGVDPGVVLAFVATGDGVGWALTDAARSTITISGGVDRRGRDPVFSKPGGLTLWAAATVEDEQPTCLAVAGVPATEADGIDSACQAATLMTVATLYGRATATPPPSEWQPGVARPGDAAHLYHAATRVLPYNLAQAWAYALAHWVIVGRPLVMPAARSRGRTVAPPRLYQGGAT